jgi:Xaa-Pro aminopeptidase
MKNLIRKLRLLFNTHSIDGYIIPKNDEFFLNMPIKID